MEGSLSFHHIEPKGLISSGKVEGPLLSRCYILQAVSKIQSSILPFEVDLIGSWMGSTSSRAMQCKKKTLRASLSHKLSTSLQERSVYEDFVPSRTYQLCLSPPRLERSQGVPLKALKRHGRLKFARVGKLQSLRGL